MKYRVMLRRTEVSVVMLDAPSKAELRERIAEDPATIWQMANPQIDSIDVIRIEEDHT